MTFRVGSEKLADERFRTSTGGWPLEALGSIANAEVKSDRANVSSKVLPSRALAGWELVSVRTGVVRSGASAACKFALEKLPACLQVCNLVVYWGRSCWVG